MYLTKIRWMLFLLANTFFIFNLSAKFWYSWLIFIRFWIFPEVYCFIGFVIFSSPAINIYGKNRCFVIHVLQKQSWVGWPLLNICLTDWEGYVTNVVTPIPSHDIIKWDWSSTFFSPWSNKTDAVLVAGSALPFAAAQSFAF